MSTVTAKRVAEMLDYDPVTGKFVWLQSIAKCVIVGTPAGSVTRNGYVRISIGRRGYLAHRLAWLFVHGEWPEGQLDHIDGNKQHNAIGNLRIANISQNRANSKASVTNKSGFKGVFFLKGRWLASIKHRGQSKHLGCFDTPEKAHAAYVIAAKNIHGDFARAA
jgi:hypothetical protein